MKGCVLMFFSDIKLKLGKKSKRAVALLATATLLCGFSGCDSKESSSAASDSSVSGLLNTPVMESKDSQSSKANSDDTGSSDAQNEQGNSQSEFNFDEVVKNITLFNSNVDLPCTIKDFGEDFSLDSEIMVSNEEIGMVSVSLLYKGRMLGMANLSAYSKEEVQSGGENMQIVQICLGDDGIDIDDPDCISEFWENSKIDLDMQGIGFTSSYDDILCMWGKPDCEYSTTSKLRLVYGKKDLLLESGKNYIEIDIIDERIASIFISAYNI